MAGNTAGVVQTTRSPIYDFTPFLPAQAVKDGARRAGMITTVSIPVTPCPSPLAANITPEQLANLKNHLTGPKSNDRGKEIWESWKRAWDLWNNNYIEGRVNPEWVKLEWDRRTQKKAAQGPKRHRYGRGLLTPRPEPEVKKKFTGPQPPVAEPGTKWVKARNDKNIVKTGRKLTRFVKKPKTIEEQKTAKPYRLAIKKFVPEMATEEETKESRTHPYFAIDHTWAALESAREGNTNLSRPSDNDVQNRPESRQVDSVKVNTLKVRMQLVKRMVRVPRNPTKLLSWTDMSQARLNSSAITQPVDEANVIYDLVEKDVWEPVGQMVDSDEYKYIQNTHSGQVTITLDPTVQMIDEEEEYSEVEEQITSHWELVDYFDDPRPRPKKPKKLTPPQSGTATPPPEPEDDGTGNADDMDDQDDVIVIVDSSDEDDEEDDSWWIPKTQDDNGSSGGFFAIKDRDEFKQPEGAPWNDIVNNTVWRPRWVGEKTLRIDEDIDEDDFLDDNDLMEDGGVDCGRRPYPALRSIDNYYSSETAGTTLFKKRTVWDEVTGTIFNMPTQPIASDDESEDERHILVRAMFSENLLPDPLAHQTDLFPLDIRRVYRKDTQPCKIDVDASERLIRYSWENPARDYRHMEEDDPWFVTPEQEDLRDVPPRRYPPKQPTYEGNNLIPTDAINWIENRVMDEMGDAGYFVTNLHGGTLIINGQEVKKGQVAGPLPPFAVIESLGGQVSFWWGTKGRNWNQALQPAPGREWEALRQVAGWEYVGLKAGVVWDWKIKDRMKREEDGEDEDDDEQWKNWKNPRSDEPDFDAMTDAEYGAYYGTQFTTDDYVVATDYGGDDHGPHKEIPPPEIFESEEDELKWIAFTAGRLKSLGDTVMASQAVEPSGPKFWSGPVVEADVPGRITEAKLEEDWKRLEKGRSKYQGAALSVTQTKKDTDLTQLLDCRTKRSGDELSQEIIKKRRTDLDAEVKRRKAKQEKEEQDAREATATVEREAREARKRKEVAAKTRAIFYEARKGKTSAEFDAWKSAYLTQQDEEAQKAKDKLAAKIKQDQADKAAKESSQTDQAVKEAEQKIREDVARQTAQNKVKAKEDEKMRKNQEAIAKQELEKQRQKDILDKKKREEEAAAKKIRDDADAAALKKKQDDEAAAAAEQKKIDDAAAAQALKDAEEKKKQEAGQNPAKVVFHALNLTPGQVANFNNWTSNRIQAVQTDLAQLDNATRTLYDQWEAWYNAHFRKAPTTGVPTTRLQIEDNLNARAFAAEKTPAQFAQDEGFSSIGAYINAVINEMAMGATRLPPLTPGEVFDNGLWARATVGRTTRQVIAKVAGFNSIVAMRNARLQQMGSWLAGTSKDQWFDHNQFQLNQLGDYEAEVKVTEQKVRDHKAGLVIPATVSSNNNGLGFEF